MQASISNRISKGAARRVLRLALLIGAISHLVSCQKEEHALRDYPRLNTLEVTGISSQGVTFNGTIISGDLSTVVKAGFAWSASVNPDINLCDTTVLPGRLTGKTFHQQVDHALEKNVNYQVRAFVTTDTYTVYGPAVSFRSMGSKAPVISGFSPASGKKGDTITIAGDNFGSYYFSNTISMDYLTFAPFHAEKTKLQFILPEGQRPGPVTIRVSVAGMPAQALQPFLIE